MEKAHGWTYVRSKNNGENKDKGSVNASIGLPVPDVATPEDDYEMETYDLAMHPNQINFPEYPTSSDMEVYEGLPQPMRSDDEIPAPNPEKNAVPNEPPSDRVYGPVIAWWKAEIYDLKFLSISRMKKAIGRIHVLLFLFTTSFIAALSFLTSPCTQAACGYTHAAYGTLGNELPVPDSAVLYSAVLGSAVVPDLLSNPK
jgi:hypothetical protein